LDDVARAREVPGAVLGVLHEGEVVEAATGVTDLTTGIPTTARTLFQIGSITKLYTATLVMQLVDEGRIDLDAPVRTYLPTFSVADSDASDAITVRHLLCHTSGMQGDHMLEAGGGDDSIDRYVRSCAELGQVHPPGEMFSYCNSGFVVAGRLVMEVTGRTWEDALQSRLLDPLGLTHTTALPTETSSLRFAVGHLRGVGGIAPAIVPPWSFPRAENPDGGICAAAGDLLAFARMHLDAGRRRQGVPVLSPGSVAAMQEPQVWLVERLMGDAWGLGWGIRYPQGQRVLGHSGVTPGQAATLTVVPERNFAAVLLTNANPDFSVSDELMGWLLRDVLGIGMRPPLTPTVPPPALDFGRYTATYERMHVRVDVERNGSHLELRRVLGGSLADPGEGLGPPEQTYVLRPVDERTFVAHMPDVGGEVPVVFFPFEDGRASYLHVRGRACPRTDREDPEEPSRS